MSKKIICLAILVISISMLFSSKCFATENNLNKINNIQYIDNITSIQELINIQNNKPMLTKSWYSYQFEVNMNKVIKDNKIYPINTKVYQQALEQVNFHIDKIGNYKIYFLDYKLKNYPLNLALSFMDDSTVVFASYYKLSEEKIHQLAVHELGHQIDFKLMDNKTWGKYIILRGLTNRKIYNNYSIIHENRPQEIFAEDFRLLFGGDKAKIITHLNRELPDPDLVPGLKEFYLSLI